MEVWHRAAKEEGGGTVEGRGDIKNKLGAALSSFNSNHFEKELKCYSHEFATVLP